MEDRCCKACVYYKQHYVKRAKRYVWVHCGHCIHPRLKSRAPETPACIHFQEKAP